MPAGSPPSSTISRARLGLPRSGTTTPKASASTRRTSTVWRSIRPCTACFASSKGPRLANALPARTKGVRAPATIATRSTFTFSGIRTLQLRNPPCRALLFEQFQPGLVLFLAPLVDADGVSVGVAHHDVTARHPRRALDLGRLLTRREELLAQRRQLGRVEHED